jgi:hypothetical protein
VVSELPQGRIVIWETLNSISGGTILGQTLLTSRPNFGLSELLSPWNQRVNTKKQKKEDRDLID